MPRRKRLSPGQTYGQSGGGLDLGGLLMAAFGGVDPNPEFLAQQGPMDPNSGTIMGQQPFKGKTVFDRANASQMNSDYFGDLLRGRQDLTNQLQLEEGSVPIRLKQKQGETDIDTKAYKEKGDYDYGLKTKFSKQESEQRTSEDTARAVNDVLRAAGIAPNNFDIGRYNREVNPEQFNRMLAGIKANIAGSNAQAADIDRVQQTAGATFPANLATAQTKANAEKQVSELQAADVPSAFADLRTRRDQELKANEANMVRGRFMNVGDNVVDIFANPMKATFYGGDPMKQALSDKFKAEHPELMTHPSALPQATNDMVEVEIDGVKVRVPRSALGRIQQAQQSSY